MSPCDPGCIELTEVRSLSVGRCDASNKARKNQASSTESPSWRNVRGQLYVDRLLDFMDIAAHRDKVETVRLSALTMHNTISRRRAAKLIGVTARRRVLADWDVTPLRGRRIFREDSARNSIDGRKASRHWTRERGHFRRSSGSPPGYNSRRNAGAFCETRRETDRHLADLWHCRKRDR